MQQRNSDYPPQDCILPGIWPANPDGVSSLRLRRMILEIAEGCGQATHIGSALSMVELLNVLFGSVLRHRPDDPEWDDRDVFILSKGHAVLGYLAVLHSYGYFSREVLATFQQNGSSLIAHPVKNLSRGIESSNGSLGQGLSFGLGLALGMTLRGQSRRHVFVMLGDGECNEGMVWEAAALAAELGAANLIAVVDKNGQRNDGSNTLFSGPRSAILSDVWRSFGWQVVEVDGHNESAVHDAYRTVLGNITQPGVIVADTIKGKGIDFMEDNNDWHHNRITSKVLESCLSQLNSDVNRA